MMVANVPQEGAGVETHDERAGRLYNAMLEALGTAGAAGMSGESDDALKDLAEKIAKEY